jgi:hypothetical protein
MPFESCRPPVNCARAVARDSGRSIVSSTKLSCIHICSVHTILHTYRYTQPTCLSPYSEDEIPSCSLTLETTSPRGFLSFYTLSGPWAPRNLRWLVLLLPSPSSTLVHASSLLNQPTARRRLSNLPRFSFASPAIPPWPPVLARFRLSCRARYTVPFLRLLVQVARFSRATRRCGRPARASNLRAPRAHPIIAPPRRVCQIYHCMLLRIHISSYGAGDSFMS